MWICQAAVCCHYVCVFSENTYSQLDNTVAILIYWHLFKNIVMLDILHIAAHSPTSQWKHKTTAEVLQEHAKPTCGDVTLTQKLCWPIAQKKITLLTNQKHRKKLLVEGYLEQWTQLSGRVTLHLCVDM